MKYTHFLYIGIFCYLPLLNANTVSASKSVDELGKSFPIPIKSLDFNPRHVAEYFLCDVPEGSSSKDLLDVIDDLSKTTPQQFERNLFELTPAAFEAFTQVNFQGQQALGQALADRNLQGYSAYNNFPRFLNETAASYPTKVVPNHARHAPLSQAFSSFWVTPLGYYYRQGDRLLETVGFKAKNYGLILGFDHAIGQRCAVGLSGMYLHSTLDWSQNRGKGRLNSGGISPYISCCISPFFHLNGGLYVGQNFRKAERKIHLKKVRTPSSRHITFDCSVFFNARGICPVGIAKHLFLQTDINVSYLNSLENSFIEKGANSLNLEVKGRLPSILASAVKGTLYKWVNKRTFRLRTGVMVGWVHKMLFKGRTYRASFHKQKTCQKWGTCKTSFHKQKTCQKGKTCKTSFCKQKACKKNFKTRLYRKKSSQLVLGAHVKILSRSNWSSTLSYEASIGGGGFIQGGRLSLDWRY